jgi:hypothetical protein
MSARVITQLGFEMGTNKIQVKLYRCASVLNVRNTEHSVE